MSRTTDLTLFRAADARLDWTAVLGDRRSRRPDWPDVDAAARRVRGREDIRLVWSVDAALGVPHSPFTVWQRMVQPPTDELELRVDPVPAGQLLSWGGVEAVTVEVHASVQDPARPVGLFLLRGGGSSPAGALAADVRSAGTGGPVQLQARCGAATTAVLVNANAQRVVVLPLQQAVDDPAWQELEVVGLPVREPLGDYPLDDQGLIVDPRPPQEAAVQRLDRTGDPLGWWPVTESGLLAPPWSPPDPAGLVDEVWHRLLPQVRQLWVPGTPEREQHLLLDERTVDPPTQDGRRVDEPAKAGIPVLATLLLAAGADPAVGIALGLGTTYRREHLMNDPAEVEFLVTARYRYSPRGDDVDLAAYLPPAPRHRGVPPVVDLAAARAALLPPPTRDAAHRESLEISWRPEQDTATLVGPVALVFAAFTPGDDQAASRLGERPGGGPQLRALTRPAPNPVALSRPGWDRPRLVDPDLPLPLEGKRSRGYAVAQVDAFGIWSPWQDTVVTTEAPVVLPPRVGRLELTSRFVAGLGCPSRVLLEVALDWTERSPERLEVVALYYPLATGGTPPPPSDTPTTVPTDRPRQDVTVTFAADAPTASAGVIEPLTDDGGVATEPGPVQQGEEVRAYRLTFDGPVLDYSTVSRWGVQVWVRQAALALTTPSAWSPTPRPPSPAPAPADGQATAVAASPVPALPVPPPQPPGVPLGSTPDAAGCSHVRIAWSGLSGPHVDRVVVWETSETTLRRHLAPDLPADRRVLLGTRLQQLWDLYEAADEDVRQRPFRRLAEFAAAPGAADVPLPRGTEDLHSFVVTAVTTTGVESRWPTAVGGAPARAHLQTFAAPRVRRPAAPLLRPAVQPDGTLVLALEASAPLPVTVFEVFATRSAAAAREHLTMGPPVATVPATASPRIDPITKDPVYEATWTGALPPSWDPWYVRAVAVPPATVDEAALRGAVSQACDVLQVSVRPTGPPDLATPVVEVLGTDHRQVLVRTSTSAPTRVVPVGAHRVLAVAGGGFSAGLPEFRAELSDLVVVSDPSAPPETLTGPVVRRTTRAGGRTELLLWCSRADASTTLPVTVRLVDPVGRAVEKTLEVPGWVKPPAELDLEVVDGFATRGGWVLQVRTSARASDLPAYVLSVLVTRRGRPLQPFDRSELSREWNLPDIPVRVRPSPVRGQHITATRVDENDGTRISLFVPVPSLAGVDFAIGRPRREPVRTSWTPF